MIAESHAERIPSESIFLPPPEEKDLQRARYALQFYREVVSPIQRVTKLKRHAMAFSAYESS